MLNRQSLMYALAVLSLFVVGCGVKQDVSPAPEVKSNQVQKTVATSETVTPLGDNPPFQNVTGTFLVKPHSNWDAKTIAIPTYSNVQVLNAAGKPITLHVNNNPILFEAYWCPHCQRTLILLSSNISHIKKKPILVSTGFKPDTTIQQAVAISHQEFSSLNLANFQVYYLLNQSLLAKYVASYPTLVFSQNGKTEQMLGEHTLALWERALS